MRKYDFKKIEEKWQKKWEKEKLYQVDIERASKPFYNLMMFPYPSAEGLHVGNMYAFTGSDIYSRYMRLKRNDVFEPIGLDGFGIHSENFAIKNKIHPVEMAKKTQKRFYEQLHMIGNAYDWSKTLETYDSDYYKWTQWIFLQMFKKGLAYRKKSAVNWCPSCKTVLSDEQVEVGKCERCKTDIVKREMSQWFFKITKYADRLLKNLDKIDWSEKTKLAQKNWIGKSEGAELKFQITKSKFQTNNKIRVPNSVIVFTTRPDTLFGCTYLVLSPESKYVDVLKNDIENWDEVKKYIEKAKAKSDLERANEKIGVELKGIKVINPANKKEIPIWVADYVLSEYGTGAIMAVPAHDERDYKFAKKYKMSIVEVVAKKFGKAKEVAVRRDGVAAVIIKDSKVLVLFDKENNEYRLPAGGYEEKDEGVLGTLEREIKEEAGYINFEVSDYLGQIETYFYVKRKKEERHKLQKGYLVKLVDDQQQEQSEEDGGVYEVMWLDKNEALKRFDEKVKDIGEHEFIRRAFDKSKRCFVGDGVIVNSGRFNGMDSQQAKKEITEFVGGKIKVNYKLRDWCISRQRFWGPPIPIIYCDKCGILSVDEKDLPVKLPKTDDYLPDGTGRSPLARDEKFVKTECPKCGGEARRETDVSDTFLDSAWYFFRYPSIGSRSSEVGIRNGEKLEIPWNQEITKRWLPVDMYIGGHEHAVLHLLYTRFVTMVFHDMGLIDFEEPFKKFRAHGLIIKDGAKMSKSKGNVVNPDEYIEKYGIDVLRTYLMFIGPFKRGGDFRDEGVVGIERFFAKVYGLAQDYVGEKSREKLRNSEIRKLAKDEFGVERNKLIKKVTEDIERLDYNTVIAGLMEFLNVLEEDKNKINRNDLEILVIILSPFAPYLCEELWEILGHKESVFKAGWPEFDEDKIREDKIELVIQVNGKVRARVKVDAGISEKEAKTIVLEQENVKKFVGEKEIKRIIFVRGKLLNIVI